MKKIFAVIFIFFTGSLLFCQSKQSNKSFYNSTDGIKNSMFSMDLNYLTLGLKNNGWGLGLSYEQYLLYHSALKINFGHNTFIKDNKMFPTVSFGMFAEYYPFYNGLNGLYFGFGGYLDYLGLKDSESSSNEQEKIQNTFTSIYPFAGYKIKICRYLSTDIYAGYKYIFVKKDSITPDNYKNYTRSGINAGCTLKIHMFK